MKRKEPKTCIDKSNRRYFVKLSGKKIYLGKLGDSPDTLQREKNRVLAEFYATASVPIKSGCITLDELILRFFKEKLPTLHPASTSHFQTACNDLLHFYTGTNVADFTPLMLETVRKVFITKGWSRKYINEQVGRLRQIIRWGTGKSLVPAGVAEALKYLEPLKEGKCDAPDHPPRETVASEIVEKTLHCLAPTMEAMVKLQKATAARPSEICKIRIENIDWSNPDCWIVDCPEHKNSWRGQKRILTLAKQEIDIITPFIGERSEGYVFQPSAAVQENKAKKAAKAKHKKKTPSRIARDKARAANPQQKLNECYSVASYRRAITRACKQAGVPHWTPYQLRHTGITDIANELGLDTAKFVAGQKTISVTENYYHGSNKIAIDLAIQRSKGIETRKSSPSPESSTDAELFKDFQAFLRWKNTQNSVE